MKVCKFRTSTFHGYNVKFSPFFPDILACAACENYGLTGRGALLVFREIQDEGYLPFLHQETPDGLFDLSWSNSDSNLLVTASGDGSICIWNVVTQNASSTVLNGHVKEVYSVDWSSRHNSNFILSASGDQSIRMWDAATGIETSIFLAHNSLTYSALWSPHVPAIFASVEAGGNLMLWDIRVPGMHPQVIPAHSADTLACDWSVLNEHIIATGGVDNAIHIWDLRHPERPLSTLNGHELAVRRVKFSPFHQNILASTSYDFSTRIWDWMDSTMLQSSSNHTEFVYGLDFNGHISERMCDCSWDATINVYDEIGL